MREKTVRDLQILDRVYLRSERLEPGDEVQHRLVLSAPALYELDDLREVLQVVVLTKHFVHLVEDELYSVDVVSDSLGQLVLQGGLHIV